MRPRLAGRRSRRPLAARQLAVQTWGPGRPVSGLRVSRALSCRCRPLDPSGFLREGPFSRSGQVRTYPEFTSMTAIISVWVDVMILTAMRPDLGTLNGADFSDSMDSHRSESMRFCSAV